MQTFETKLAQATSSGDMLGAIALVVDNKGQTLYHHASGRQSLDANAPPLDPDSTVVLASAGKFITHVAALQLVERGFVTLDEPLLRHLPELESLPLCTRLDNNRSNSSNSSADLALHPPMNKITLRHLLLHTSGLSDSEALQLSGYFASDKKLNIPHDAHPIVRNFSLPLIFEPGQGFAYGCSIHWTQLLVSRLASFKRGQNFLTHIQEHVFDPLGMTSSTYTPQDDADIWGRRLRMVERADGQGEEEEQERKRLIPADDVSQGLTCSVSDMGAVLGDLISPSPKLLRKKEHVDLLFMGQLSSESDALRHLRENHENYAFCAGKSCEPRVNWSAAGLVIEDDGDDEDEDEKLKLSGMPGGTVTWEGMPNVMWAMNREKGLAMFFATQLIPVGDEKANGLARAFMGEAWNTFG